MTGLESLVAENTGPGTRVRSWGLEDWRRDLLHGDAILGDMLVTRLPNESDVAGIGSLESPREECRDCIPAD